MGGGKFVDGIGWVDKNNPAYNTPDNTQASPTNTAGGAPGDTAAVTTAQQAQNASSNSGTPTAAPNPTTTNQGTQDVVRNTYLQQATQPVDVNAQTPVVKSQTDAYRAEVGREINDFLNQQAEAAGPYATGALRGQARMAAEKGGVETANFQAQAIANELQSKRAEVQNALSQLGGLITADQQAALQKQLADLDAQLKTLGISTSAQTAANQLAVQQALGVGGLNLGLIQALLQNQQFGDSLGLNAAEYEAYLNNQAGQSLL